MSQSRELHLHIAQLKEIRSILNSMKNLAIMQIHKLQRFKAMQAQVVFNIEQTALDFLHFYPELRAAANHEQHVCIVLGAERGFCGDFNDGLIKSVSGNACSGIIAIGSRLSARLDGLESKVIADIEGANVTEEVPVVLNRLIEAITELHGDGSNAKFAHTLLQLTVVYHDDASNRIIRQQILPPFFPQSTSFIPSAQPPILNLKPADFFAELVDHYLFAKLHDIFYSSLLAENQHRQQHLEGALNHLDEENIKLQRKSQLYRQEEITEEIEVILLNAENLTER